MANFYNYETKEPLKVLYISTSRKGNVILHSPRVGFSMRSPEIVVANGQGKAGPAVSIDPGRGDYRCEFTDLMPGTEIVALDGNSNVLAKLPVKHVSEAGSYKWINERFNNRGMKISLDSHIDYVCYASEILGEGISFRPKSAAQLTTDITDTQLFHHDDRSDFFGKEAASSTIGEGYREVSTPSLHVAISADLASVHIDSYAFQFMAPDGMIIIGPDAGQHIVDELWFRLPMTWLRRKNMTFLASVLQALHPVLPNSVNGYSPRLGIRVELGGTPGRDLRSGSPRLTFETTVDFTLNTTQRMRSDITLRLLSGGNPDKSPDWVLSLKADYVCRDTMCRDKQDSVGLYFTAGGK